MLPRLCPNPSPESDTLLSQRPWEITEVHGPSKSCVSLQKTHDDCHGRLIVTGAAGARLVHDVPDADMRIITCRRRAKWCDYTADFKKLDRNRSNSGNSRFSRLATEPCSRHCKKTQSLLNLLKSELLE